MIAVIENIIDKLSRGQDWLTVLYHIALFRSVFAIALEKYQALNECTRKKLKKLISKKILNSFELIACVRNVKRRRLRGDVFKKVSKNRFLISEMMRNKNHAKRMIFIEKKL